MINVMYIVFLAMMSLAVSFDDGTDEVTEEAGQEEIAIVVARVCDTDIAQRDARLEVRGSDSACRD